MKSIALEAPAANSCTASSALFTGHTACIISQVSRSEAALCHNPSSSFLYGLAERNQTHELLLSSLANVRPVITMWSSKKAAFCLNTLTQASPLWHLPDFARNEDNRWKRAPCSGCCSEPWPQCGGAGG